MKNISPQLSTAGSPQCHTSLGTSSAKENFHTPTHTSFKVSFPPMTDQYRVRRLGSLFKLTTALKGYPAPELPMELAEDSIGDLLQLNLSFYLILLPSPPFLRLTQECTVVINVLISDSEYTPGNKVVILTNIGSSLCFKTCDRFSPWMIWLNTCTVLHRKAVQWRR